MKISVKGLELIKHFEGCALKSYYDGAGKVFSIGYGHTGGVQADQYITQEQADQFLKQDVCAAEKGVDSLIKVNITQYMFDALVSFVYNCGIGTLTNSKIPYYINTGNPAAAADEFLKYVFAKGVKLNGLIRRRTSERELFLSENPQLFANEYEEIGNAKVIVDKLNIRSYPSLSGTLVGSYDRGQSFSYNRVIHNDGYVWVEYIGRSSGLKRYVAVKNLTSGKRYAQCW